VLIASTVVEVGVDVPAATVMLVENAYCFGLAQLHQLRGRVGRGARRSACYLMGPPSSAPGAAAATGRLRVLERSSNGLEIAENDLRIRCAVCEVVCGCVWGAGARREGRMHTHMCTRGSPLCPSPPTTHHDALPPPVHTRSQRVLLAARRGPGDLWSGTKQSGRASHISAITRRELTAQPLLIEHARCAAAQALLALGRSPALKAALLASGLMELRGAGEAPVLREGVSGV
jgi:hypothetical protein